ncbi:beta-1,4-mannosyl-glycoprotein 4-beta-N-acetylglucosaminyltransferase-like [Phymastichus coffea]|uniref:beta-1,4-mannosyl-glycoprotein 4-beta-N-acetylglucosaminyltransferase-like n=1 Tax=Phymastichus coffea TaxID=108790 RepID=UPI00273B837A|nr:beta-1,4-mannosyl-glycoprotein 4-beta-N-acetylglucosaminyltransferase-like [Phymastichus coffea]XP_058809590.1 beta-1,4-mannosyl-glycoprotein 4-beta-N-acetylglucosaminyltransferase-like [Phymastichus coffea]
MQPKIDWKLALLYTLLVLQVLIVMIYVTSTPHVTDLSAPVGRDGVSFVDMEAPQQYYENKSRELHIITGETSLRDVRTFKLFHAYNRTQCWRSGVDERQMQRDDLDNAATNEVEERRCACNQGWHGSDCGQPEVVWRAIMASKQNVKLSRRKLARRIVHTFYVSDHNSAIAEVIVEELYPVVDLFVICDLSSAEDNFRHKLAKGFLAKQQDKILYVNMSAKLKKPPRVISKYVWEYVKRMVKNIRDDDIYVTTDAEQILNARALMFLKVYDGWPQPIGFRLRWSVFGFFWQHPQKTTITIGACTVGLMREAHRFNSLILEKELTNEIQARDTLGLVIGDLNHYGGWYCQFCQGPANVLVALREMNRTRELVIERSVDVPFIEDLIGSGMWFDEKTSLLRAYRSRESYYAPDTVTNKTWKYDWLVENFYAKLDYY